MLLHTAAYRNVLQRTATQLRRRCIFCAAMLQKQNNDTAVRYYRLAEISQQTCVALPPNKLWQKKCADDSSRVLLGECRSERNALQHTATHCNALQHTAATAIYCTAQQHTATQCNTLQHTATHCNTLQRAATHRNTL